MSTFDVAGSYKREIFENFLNEFLPGDFKPGERQVFFNSSIINGDNSFMLGVCDSLDLAVYELNQIKDSDPRVTITKETVKLMKNFCPKNNVLAVFYNKDSNQWRFSLITSDVSVSDKGKVLQKFSNPHRYSFLLGEGCKRHTPESMLFDGGHAKTVKDLEDLKSRFAIETVTKEFYNQLFAWYEWAVSLCEFNHGRGSVVNKSKEQNNEHIIRLITRFMFVWFLKQKDLIPSWIFDEKEIENILNNFDLRTAKSVKNGCYYNAVIQNLFFATLNKAINEREFARETQTDYDTQYGIKTLYRDNNGSSFFKISHKKVIELFKTVPFLNGGLFECLDRLEGDKVHNENKQVYCDGFSREATRRAFVPNALFWNDEEDKNLGLIKLLNTYNFTVEENTPSDIQVALDPELLGKVFENLLGAYNPETQETARKDSGSFYTPREIVEYMVNESLIQYLTKNIHIDGNEIRDFIEHSDVSAIPANKRKQVSEALRTVKVFDSACGSGAFPVGMLNKLVELIRLIEGNISTYLLKLDLIRDCLFGSDIQNIAVQIAKLRFFISLVCEQNKTNDENKNYGFNPLPNLETKFVCANSLIGLTNKEDWTTDEELVTKKKELQQIREKHFKAKSSSEKKELREADEIKRDEMAKILKRNHCEPNKKHIAVLQAENKDNEKQLQLVKEPKLVDMTETQGDLFGTSHLKLSSVDINKEKRDFLTKRIVRNKKLIDAEYNKKADEHFEKQMKLLLKWDPYDQNSSSGFFDPEWMFNVKDGFDIVIGNPPYIQLQKYGGKLGKMYENYGFETFASMGDIYSLFYERGIQLLKPNGNLCYITSNKWMRSGYGEKTRSFFAKNNPLTLIDFAGIKIFESATVDTNILLLQKSENKKQTTCCIAKDKSCRDNLSDYIQQNSSVYKFDNSDSWIILSPIEQSIKNKIERIGVPLKDWDIQINYGIKTGFNDAFIITTEKRNEILSSCKSAEERKRTEELIRPILRGRDIKRYSYQWANLWLIATFPAKHYDIEKYTAVKEYLLSFGMERLEQTGKEYEINGEKIKARKKTNNQWFETQDSISYWDDFSQQKIVWKRVGSILRFSFDDRGMMVLDSTCFATGNHIKYLDCFLNSRMGNYLLQEAPKTGTGDLLISVQAVEPLKIPIPSKEIEEEFSKLMNVRVKNEDASIDQKINCRIYELYGLSNEEIKFIERK